MQSITVVISQANADVARQLCSGLQAHFRRVVVAKSFDELREVVLRHRALLAVVDLDTADLSRIRTFCADFPQVSVVCTHHAPDEEMWMSAMDAGALECCHYSDIHSILNAMHARRIQHAAA